MKTNVLKIFAPILFLFILILSGGMSGCRNHKADEGDIKNQIDTLKVATLYGPTSYFDYRGEIMGIDYENVSKFAEEEGMVLDIHTVDNIQDLIEELKNGTVHLAAYPVPSIAEYNSEVLHCGRKEVSRQVLVQKKGTEKINDVTELVGKDIYVEKGSKYFYRLQNLNDELGGGINIHTLESDTITSEDLIQMVSNGEIPFTVVDSQIAALTIPDYPDIDTSLSLSADQAASWAVAPGLDSLAAKINRWENSSQATDFVKSIYKRYYDRAAIDVFDTNLSYFKKLNLSKNKTVSPFDNLFKKYGESMELDWRLLAAIAYCESNFNPTVVSRFGASGLMQVMPSTAQAMGVDPSTLDSPENNVRAASKILKKLDSSFQNKVKDPQERVKFVVAAYNSGLGHIFDAMALAEKIGLDPQKWTGNVSVAALMKSRPEYYNDPVVKHGYFRGRETVDFVDHVTSIQNFLTHNIPH